MIRLGSSSSIRAKILNDNNVHFIQSPGTFDEDSIKTKDPKEFVRKATLGKFNELFEKYGVDDMPLLVADTVVTTNGELLRKAIDKDDARRMLELQSGSTTSVITCMIYKSKESYIFDVETTTYEFSVFDAEKLNDYIESGDCMGKAGAMMIEGFFDPYIKKADGYKSTTMGLCIEKLLVFL